MSSDLHTVIFRQKGETQLLKREDLLYFSVLYDWKLITGLLVLQNKAFEDDMGSCDEHFLLSSNILGIKTIN